jgi:hypothetical protein
MFDLRRISAFLIATWLATCVAPAEAQTNATIDVSFFRQASLDLNQGALCFLRFRDPAKRLPLFAAGAARRGNLRLFMTSSDLGFTVRSEANAIVDVDPPVGSADAAAVDDTAAARLLKGRAPLRLAIRDVQLRDVMVSDSAWKTMIDAARAGQPKQEPYSAHMDVDVKMDLVAQTASTTVTLPMRMTVRYCGLSKFGRLQPYWRLELSGDCAIEGKTLGLTDRDAGRLDVHAEIACASHVPRDYAAKQVNTELDNAAEIEVAPQDGWNGTGGRGVSEARGVRR